MKPSRPELPLYVLAGVGLAAIAVVIATGHAVPAALYGLVAAVLAGGLGLTVPSSQATAVLPDLSTLAAPLVDAVRSAIHDVEASYRAQTASAASEAAPVASTATETVPAAQTATQAPA
jgi:hypothetical protein